MAATVSVKQGTGSATGGLATTNTTITNLRFTTADAANNGSSQPLVKPASGTNYSYWASVYLNADTTPTGTINNVKFYTDGTDSYGTGVGVNCAVATTYVQATGTSGTTGTQLTTGNHTGLDASPSDAFGYSSGSPLSVTGSISNPSTGKITRFVVLQMTLSTSVSAGTLSTETFTFQYDET